VATPSPSAALRKQLRQKLLERIETLHLNHADAAEQLGLSTAQMSRLAGNEDIFSFDRLIDAAARIGLTVRVTATRPYRGR
jgi:predicted XRE-type DNA-binding protein